MEANVTHDAEPDASRGAAAGGAGWLGLTWRRGEELVIGPVTIRFQDRGPDKARICIHAPPAMAIQRRPDSREAGAR